eukprot:TRINITY_DN1261_c0_g2_i1.p1 TRINITY_DN1261_c0_g2~~TRINITY_DN1261_c0_g2_i1.p1  ORF type:complete len:125 (-),score=32.87 TRINITY_DN1261_c0_g2_i1:12-386(-)
MSNNFDNNIFENNYFSFSRNEVNEFRKMTETVDLPKDSRNLNCYNYVKNYYECFLPTSIFSQLYYYGNLSNCSKHLSQVKFCYSLEFANAQIAQQKLDQYHIQKANETQILEKRKFPPKIFRDN